MENVTEQELRQLAAWWRRCKGDESFRTALDFCAGQLELALDGQLPPFTATVWQGGKTPHWIDSCHHDSLTGDEGPIAELGRMPTRWRCDECGAVLVNDELT